MVVNHWCRKGDTVKEWVVAQSTADGSRQTDGWKLKQQQCERVLSRQGEGEREGNCASGEVAAQRTETGMATTRQNIATTSPEQNSGGLKQWGCVALTPSPKWNNYQHLSKTFGGWHSPVIWLLATAIERRPKLIDINLSSVDRYHDKLTGKMSLNMSQRQNSDIRYG